MENKTNIWKLPIDELNYEPDGGGGDAGPLAPGGTPVPRHGGGGGQADPHPSPGPAQQDPHLPPLQPGDHPTLCTVQLVRSWWIPM